MADSTHSGLTAFLLAQLYEGMTVVDIGANQGELTAVAAACVGPSGNVVAYEPSPATARALRVRLGDARHCEIRQCALAERAGKSAFYVDPSKSTSSTLYPDAIGPVRQKIRVTVQTLDAEAPLLPPVDLIKIDAQGAEGRIFEGARRLLKRDKPLLIFELWPHGLRAAGTDGTRLLNDLAGLGYHFHPLNAKGRVGHDGKIRALLAGELRSAALNVVAHPRRWPAREWREIRPPEPCVLPRTHRALCHAWIAADSAAAAALSV
jgi:FkbM family methyltransferase